MEKAIFDVGNKTITFEFEGAERVIKFTEGIDYDFWGSFEVCGEFFDYNLWMDEFKVGVMSFQFGVYNLVEGIDGNLTIGDCVGSYEVEAINYEGDLETAVFGETNIVDTNSVDYIKRNYSRMKLAIDSESVNIYIDNGENREPSHICYWHIDEVEEDSSVAISMVNAINLFHTNKLELIETLFGKVK